MNENAHCNTQRNNAIAYKLALSILRKICVAPVFFLLLLTFDISSSYAIDRCPLPAIIPRGPTIACADSAGGVTCPLPRPNNNYIYDTRCTRDDGILQMYEQHVEEPCFAKGGMARCSANNYFNSRIRMNIRYCVGVPFPMPIGPKSACQNPLKFFTADCWKLTCLGAMMDGYKDLGFGQCDFIKNVRFCARLTKEGKPNSNHEINFGNRTAHDPDYRPIGSPYSAAPGDTFTLTNGKTITIAHSVSTVSKNGKDVQIGKAVVTRYGAGTSNNGDRADLDAGVVYYMPDGLVRVEGREDDKRIPIYLTKIGSEYRVVSPRLQLCAFEDPLDGNDSNPKWQFMQHNTDGKSFNGSMESYATILGLTTGLALFIVGPAILGPAVVAMAVLVLVAAIQSSINHVVMDDEGCIDVPLSPNPPPYPNSISEPIPMPSGQPICTSTQKQTTNNCVDPKIAGQYDTFEEPRIRVGFNDIINNCTVGQIATAQAPCVSVDSSDLDSATGGFTTAGKTRIITQLTNSTLSALPAPIDVRPTYGVAVAGAGGVVTYPLQGVMLNDYADLKYTFTLNPTLNDYSKGNNTIVLLSDPRDATLPKRKLFSCMTADATKICAYEALSGMPSVPGGQANNPIPYPCQYADNEQYAREINCVDRQPMSPITLAAAFPTCATQAEQEAQNPNCSSHTHPLLQATMSDQTLIFGTKADEYIKNITDAGGAVNPVRSNPLIMSGSYHYPDGQYSQCRAFYGITFCTNVTDSAGKSAPILIEKEGEPPQYVPAEYVEVKNGNGDVIDAVYKRGIGYDLTGYTRGGAKLCLSGYTPSANVQVLAKKINSVVSNDPADVLVANYVPGQHIVYAGRIPSSEPLNIGETEADRDRNINNDREGLRNKTAAELSMCVAIPGPLPCPAIAYLPDEMGTYTKSNGDSNANGNALWDETSAIISDYAGVTDVLVEGSCRKGWTKGSGGKPQRVCTVDANGDPLWGPVISGGCVINSCPKWSTTITDNISGVGSRGFDCDFPSVNILSLSSDGCHRDGYGNRDRSACCQHNGTWSQVQEKNHAEGTDCATEAVALAALAVDKRCEEESDVVGTYGFTWPKTRRSTTIRVRCNVETANTAKYMTRQCNISGQWQEKSACQ